MKDDGKFKSIVGVDIRLIEPNIIRYEVAKDTVITHHLIQEIFEAGNSILNGQKRKVLIVFDTHFTPKKEAADFMVSPLRTENLIAEAFCVNSASLKIISNFYTRIKKPTVNSKIFDNEQRALAWLTEQV